MVSPHGWAMKLSTSDVVHSSFIGAATTVPLMLTLARGNCLVWAGCPLKCHCFGTPISGLAPCSGSLEPSCPSFRAPNATRLADSTSCTREVPERLGPIHPERTLWLCTSWLSGTQLTASVDDPEGRCPHCCWSHGCVRGVAGHLPFWLF
jgi:hypothetical protein